MCISIRATATTPLWWCLAASPRHPGIYSREREYPASPQRGQIRPGAEGAASLNFSRPYTRQKSRRKMEIEIRRRHLGVTFFLIYINIQSIQSFRLCFFKTGPERKRLSLAVFSRVLLCNGRESASSRVLIIQRNGRAHRLKPIYPARLSLYFVIYKSEGFFADWR